MAADATGTIEGVSTSVIVLSSLVAAAGIAVVIGPGYLNPLRFGPYFIAFGTVCFFIPGLFGVVGGVFLRRERARWAWRVATAGVSLQLVIATVGSIAQFFFSPISPVPLLLCFAWMLASALLVWRLKRISGAVGSDADAHRGFPVDMKPPQT
jgi:uncharacterized membrane protein